MKELFYVLIVYFLMKYSYCAPSQWHYFEATVSRNKELKKIFFSCFVHYHFLFSDAYQIHKRLKDKSVKEKHG